MSLQRDTKNSIKGIEVFRVPHRWLFVRVETIDGIVGWGEATLEGHTEAVEGALAALRDQFLGWDADGIEDIWQHAYRGGFYRGGPVLMSALSGLDIALWDIKGKKLGTPIWQLLGGKVRDRVRVYGWIGGDRPGSTILVEAAKRRQQGFTAVKMNATESIGWLDSRGSLDKIAFAVASVQGLGLDVGVDFHGRLHKPTAKQLAKLLEHVRPMFIEEPLLPTQPEEIADLARQVSIPIALGERLYTRSDFRPYFEKRAVDIAQPDVRSCPTRSLHAALVIGFWLLGGGISELRRIASFAEIYDVAIAPHCPIGPIALAACIQVALNAPNFVIQEMSWEIHYNERADLYTYLADASVLSVKDGHIIAPVGPGLGITINEQLVKEAAADCKPWATLTWRGPDGTLREW